MFLSHKMNLIVFCLNFWGHFKIGGTKLVSNQLGYVFANETDTFVHDKFIEL